MELDNPHARVLAKHRSRPRCYELCGTRTASVRDQIMRAFAVAEALCAGGADQPEIHSGAPLLVIGGGAAGVTAAVTAAEAGVPCLLIERQHDLFQRQWEVTTRWLDPTEFDWPQPHWTHTTWPHDDPHDPHAPAPAPGWLVFAPGRASDLARQWHDDLEDWLLDQHEQRAQGQPAAATLHIERSLSSTDCTLNVEPDAILLSCTSRPLPWQRFGAVISCVGQGTEITRLTPGDPYRGFRFWNTDPLVTPFAGLSTGSVTRPIRPVTPRHLLVSGGGDGAQQDIQRVLCGDFGRRLLVDRFFARFGRLRREIDTSALHQADRERHDALRRSTTPKERDAALARWDATYRQACDTLWSDLSAARQQQVAHVLLRPEVIDRDLDLTWVLRGTRPTYGYSLNRFLTALVLQAYALVSNRPLESGHGSAAAPATTPANAPAIVLTGYTLTGILGHTCTGDPWNCHGQPHTVTLAASAGAGDAGRPLELTAHAILLRHGLEPEPLFGGAPLGEQYMPLGLAE